MKNNIKPPETKSPIAVKTVVNDLTRILYVWDERQAAAQRRMKEYYEKEKYELSMAFERELYAIKKCSDELRHWSSTRFAPPINSDDSI